jgi:hypothetical protein
MMWSYRLKFGIDDLQFYITAVTAAAEKGWCNIIALFDTPNVAVSGTPETKEIAKSKAERNGYLSAVEMLNKQKIMLERGSTQVLHC